MWYLNIKRTNSDWIYSLLGLDGLTQQIFEFSLEIVLCFFHRFFERRYELSISSREPRRKTTHLNWKSIKFIQRGVYNNLWIELTRPYHVFGCGRPCCKQAHHVKIGPQEQAIFRCFWPRLKVRHDYEDGFLRFVSVKWNSSDHEEHWNVNELKDLHMRIRLHYKDLRARLVFICKARLLSGFKFLITLCCIFTRMSGRKETHSKNDIFRWNRANLCRKRCCISLNCYICRLGVGQIVCFSESWVKYMK